MHNNLFSIKISILSLSLIGHSIFASQVIEKDALDRETCLKLAIAGTICVSGYCIYNLWQQNKKLKNNNKNLNEELTELHHINRFFLSEITFWGNRAEEEKKKPFQLNTSLQQELNGYKRLLREEREEHQSTQDQLNNCKETIQKLTTFQDFSDSDEDFYFSSSNSLSPNIVPIS